MAASKNPKGSSSAETAVVPGPGELLEAISIRIGSHDSDRVALTVPESSGEARRVSYGELTSLATRIESACLAGLGDGESVAFFMRRSPEHVAAILAALGRATYFSINPQVAQRQIFDMTRRARCRVLLLDNAGLLKLGKATADDLPDVRLFHVPDGPMVKAHETALASLDAAIGIETLERAAGEAPERAIPPVSPVLLLFTSGSTGMPRGVMIGPDDLARRIRSEAKSYRIEPGDRLLNVLPFSFDVGCIQLLSALYSGAELVLLNSWSSKDIVSTLSRFEITGISAVPSIWKGIMAHDEDEAVAALGHLRYLTISAGDLPAEKHEELRVLAPQVHVFKTYGQTETFRSGMLLPEEYADRPISVGRPPEGVEVRIRTDEGRMAAPDEPGEIIHKGVGTMLGYLDDAESTQSKLRSADESQWVHTGDRGRIDAEGFLYVMGREDRMLKIRGNRVYPEEIERTLETHPSIAAAVVVPDDGTNDEIELIAGISLKPGSTEQVKDIVRFLARQVPSYMATRRIVLIDEMPMTATGKTDLKAARERLVAS